MFGKPSSASMPAPVDMLPDTTAARTSSGGESFAGRDVLLAASPFSPESKKFFNKDAQERKVSFQPREDAFTEVLAPLPPGAPLPASVARAGDPLADALRPGLNEVSKFGIPFNNNPDAFDEGEIRETLRRILRRL
jgi:hypothetical protein